MSVHFLVNSFYPIGRVDPGTMGDERTIDNLGTIKNRATVVVSEKMAKETAAHPM